MFGAFKRQISILIIFYLCSHVSAMHAAHATLSKNDPLPVFTADPQLFLTDAERLYLKDPEFAEEKRDFVFLTISPFGQIADRGKTISGEKFIADVPVELSDLTGHLSMIPLLFGKTPEGETLPPLLQEARANLFPGVPANQVIEDGKYIDPQQRFGFLSCPLKYRKRGVRFDFVANLFAGIGFHFQTGVANICQTANKRQIVESISGSSSGTGTGSTFGGFGVSDSTGNTFSASEIPGKDLTCFANIGSPCPFDPSPLTQENVIDYLTSQFNCIAQELCISLCDTNITSIDEVRFMAFWRCPYELNREKPHWPHLFIIPWFDLGGSISPGKKTYENFLFRVPFGNNGHNAVFFATGLNFDFIETIEIGAEVGVTHFFSRDYPCLRVPNSKFQQVMFPFGTCANVDPGRSWHFGLKLAAYHFCDKLSAWAEFFIVNHEEDSICLLKNDMAFLPKILEKTTDWKVKLLNMSLAYDISPNTQLGFVWQAPLDQRNAYRSSTVMFTFNASF